jgi:hypothetical protein
MTQLSFRASRPHPRRVVRIAVAAIFIAGALLGTEVGPRPRAA